MSAITSIWWLPVRYHVLRICRVNWTARPSSERRLGTGVVSGIVVDDAGQTLAHAFIRLIGDVPLDGKASLVRADQEGRFQFRDVPLGRYVLLGVKVSFGTADHPATAGPNAGLPGVPLTLTNTDRRILCKLVLPRLGAIEGTVMDANGEPLTGVDIQALQVLDGAGSAGLVQTGAPTETDDRGASTGCMGCRRECMLSALDCGRRSAERSMAQRKAIFPQRLTSQRHVRCMCPWVTNSWLWTS